MSRNRKSNRGRKQNKNRNAKQGPAVGENQASLPTPSQPAASAPGWTRVQESVKPEEGKLKLSVARTNRKSLSMKIRADNTIEVRAPLSMSDEEIFSFVDQHMEWIHNHLHDEPRELPPRLTKEELNRMGDEFAVILKERIPYYAEKLQVRPGQLTLRNQRSKWGSCSASGNLSFNIMLMLAPEDVRDYVIVHELCHLRHMNHSPEFWAEVARLMPDYQEKRRWLKEHGETIMAQNPNY